MFKTTLIAMAASFSAMGFASESLTQTYTAELVKWQIDSQLPYSQTVTGGTVTVDYILGEATLTLEQKPNCQPGTFCPQFISSEVVAKLPILSKTTDACGALTIIARTDRVSSTTALQQLTIRDNSNDHCMILRPATEVTFSSQILDQETAKMVTTSSAFSGDTLRRSE